MKATNGAIMTEAEAKLLTDNADKVLEWKQDKDNPNVMTAKGTDGPTAEYNYTIEKIQPIKVQVTVTKNRKDAKEIIKMKNKINKVDVDAEEVEVHKSSSSSQQESSSSKKK